MTNIKCQKSGFTLIEILVFLFIFTISVLSFYNAFSVATNYIIETKKKLGAIGLANEEIEKKRNLGYENLPTGATADVETTKNGITYYVTTNINDFDDSDDGSGEEINWDYKKVNVDVYWVLNDSNKMITVNAIVVPPVIEKDADKGYIRLHVINQGGSGLAGAAVSVIELATSSLIYSGSVDSSGNLFLTGLNPGLHKIIIGDSNNYYPVETKDETASFDPADDHADVAAKSLIEKTIQTDIVSTLNISIEDAFENTISGLGFDITGGKFIGIENGTDNKYDFSDSVSGSDGNESFSDMSFGPYFLDFTDLNDGTTNYQFLWMEPISDQEDKVFLNADEELDAVAKLASESEPSLLVTVADDTGPDPVADVSVRLQLASDPLIYDVTLTTNVFGKVYFPETASEITNEPYSLTVSADGYGTENETVNISDFTTEDITLSAS